MDRYRRVEKPKENERVKENEIRITMQGRIRNYITYAMGLLEEKDSGEIILKAMGRAINKTVMITELLKRRVAGLHQNTSISSTDITDKWEPLEEGLLPLETSRHVSTITITLSKKELDASSSGYQSPISPDLVKTPQDFGYLHSRTRHRAVHARADSRGVRKEIQDHNGNTDHDGIAEHSESTGLNNGSAKAHPRRHGHARGGGRSRGARNHKLEEPVPA